MGPIASLITSLNRLFQHRSKKTSKLRVTGLCAGNSPGTGEFPAQRASYAENVSIWWRHHAMYITCQPYSSVRFCQKIFLWPMANQWYTAPTKIESGYSCRRFRVPSQHRDRLSRYCEFHYKDKTAARESYLYSDNFYTCKTASLYWNGC